MFKEQKTIAGIIGILAIILIVLLIISGCGKAEPAPYYFYEGESPRFTVIERGTDYAITVDTQTGVEYLMTNHGNVTVLVDKDGKPLLANGWRDYE